MVGSADTPRSQYGARGGGDASAFRGAPTRYSRRVISIVGVGRGVFFVSGRKTRIREFTKTQRIGLRATAGARLDSTLVVVPKYMRDNGIRQVLGAEMGIS